MRSTLACALLVAGGVAFADSSEDYERAYRRGLALVDRQDWAAARAQFQAAWAIEERPILLFNIASTYLHEDDRANARDYYRRYLAVADDEKLAALARERLAALEAEPTPTPPRAPSAERYPAALIDRPATLPAGTLAVGAGIVIAPRFTAAPSGGVATSYDALATAAAGYAPIVGLELDAEADVVLAAPDRGLATVRGEFALASGSLTASLRASLAYAFDAGFYDLRVGAPLRWKLANRLALVSSEDHLLVTLDDAHSELFVRAPLGLAFQLAPRIYGEVATRLAVVELRAPSLRLLGADYKFASLTLAIVPRHDLDFIVQARAYDAGGDATVFVRYRR